MGKRHYCDYCDAFLTNDSAKGRKQHIHGAKHRDLLRQYYERFLGDPRYAPPRASPQAGRPSPALLKRSPQGCAQARAPSPRASLKFPLSQLPPGSPVRPSPAGSFPAEPWPAEACPA